MPTPEYDPEIEAAALEEIDRLTAEYKEAQAEVDARREALHNAIKRHLAERNAAPGKLAKHSTYDRNHIRRLGIEAGVPALREPKAAAEPEPAPPVRRPRKNAS